MSRSDTPLLRLDAASKRFPSGLLALDRISLDVPRGGFVALVGPSGSGKSTALRLMARLSAPSAGAVHWSEAKPRIGVVFQEPTLMPWARIDDNAALPLRLQGIPRTAARMAARAMLAHVGLADFAGSYPRELSGGMKMRAALARALVTEPHLLLLDEPFAALDEIARAKLNQDLLALWQSRPRAIVFVTHSVAEAVFLAERVVVLSARPGRIVDTVEVAIPYPRPDALRLTPAFAAIAARVSAALQATSAGQPDAA